jgi:hypothetical protein
MGEFEIAHLSTSDGIGIELFSFPNGLKKHLLLTLSTPDFSISALRPLISNW